MLTIPSDMNIKVRWLAPMRVDGELLEHHTLVIRDGRILDVLPHAAAAERYAPSVVLERPTHLALPGLVNARTRIAPLPGTLAAGFWADGALLSIANMLRAGISCFCEVGCFPREVATLALAQGMRAVIGLPVAEHASAWAHRSSEYFTRAIQLRDEYKGHPSISTRFAPLRTSSLGDETLGRLGTLAAELDAGILAALHESREDVEESVRRSGKRPLERFHELGLLTPGLTAAHMTQLGSADRELVQRSGAALTWCLSSGLMRGHGVPATSALSGLRVSLGTDGEHCGPAQDLWSEIRLLALHWAPEGDRPAESSPPNPWRVLGAATRGGAEALGLESEIGTLEPGKSADVCCVDLAAPAVQPLDDPMRRLVFAGGRDLVSDVWVAGRHLLIEGRLTRVDWPELASRLGAVAPPAKPSTLLQSIEEIRA
ncbi:MAG TPA: amidohydrolase family protein [Steroidobacteraceae bacterium]|jgi:5-methylthioadenosine/S-adenosylhomocysteine deaminase|nr:amidohydrolase family protein [Steroidobacteraceae bacterium]